MDRMNVGVEFTGWGHPSRRPSGPVPRGLGKSQGMLQGCAVFSRTTNQNQKWERDEREDKREVNEGTNGLRTFQYRMCICRPFLRIKPSSSLAPWEAVTGQISKYWHNFVQEKDNLTEW
eukprot:EG_transcript_19642